MNDSNYKLNDFVKEICKLSQAEIYYFLLRLSENLAKEDWIMSELYLSKNLKECDVLKESQNNDDERLFYDQFKDDSFIVLSYDNENAVIFRTKDDFIKYRNNFNYN